MIGQLERPECIDHDGQLVGFPGADALLHRSGMGAVWDTAGVQGDHPFLYMFTAHKVAIDVVEHFIAVDIAVIIGRRDSQRMVIEQSRHKRANDEVAAGEGLVYGGRLMDPAGNGFKIVNGERIGVHVPVPAYQVEGVVEIIIGIDLVLLFDVKEELAMFIMGLQQVRFADIAFAEGRMLGQLPEFIAVTARGGDRPGGFDDKQAVVRPFEFQLVDGAARDDEVVAVLERHVAVHGTKGTRAHMNEDHLIGIGILEKVVAHALTWGRQADLTVNIDQYRLAAPQVIIFRINPEALQATVLELFILHDRRRYRPGVPHLNDLSGGISMV